MKPILFNTEMVQAILAGRKKVTRRAIPDQRAGLRACDELRSAVSYCERQHQQWSAVF